MGRVTRNAIDKSAKRWNVARGLNMYKSLTNVPACWGGKYLILIPKSGTNADQTGTRSVATFSTRQSAEKYQREHLSMKISYLIEPKAMPKPEIKVPEVVAVQVSRAVELYTPVYEGSTKITWNDPGDAARFCLLFGTRCLKSYDTLGEAKAAQSTTFQNVLTSLWIPPTPPKAEMDEEKMPKVDKRDKFGMKVCWFGCDEVYNVMARGVCVFCNDFVWTDQPRSFDAGRYAHEKCPTRVGGHIDEINKWDAYWSARKVQWLAEKGRVLIPSVSAAGERTTQTARLDGEDIEFKLL